LDRDNHESDIAVARTALGEDRFLKLLAEGKAMTLEQAVEYVLAV
jgi:hypothetical protein